MSRSRASSFTSSLASDLTSSDPEDDSLLDEPTVSLSRNAPPPPPFNPSSTTTASSNKGTGSTTRVPLRDHSSFQETSREGMMGHDGEGGARGGPAIVTELEERVLNEYERLLENLNALSARLHALSSMPTAEVLDELRSLERKMGLVFTLLKASVYSIVLQQEVVDAPPLD